MKNLILLIGIVTLYWVSHQQREINIELQSQIEEMDSVIKARQHIDTLYWNHLSQCAFVLRKDVSHDQFN